MIPRLSAAICAAMFVTTSLAMAGTTGNGWSQRAAASTTYTLRVGTGSDSHTHKVIVTLHLASSASWAYDPSSGGVSQLPSTVDNLNPIGGIGIVVKKNPGGSAERVIGDLNGDGVATFMPNIPPGSYDIVISVPAHAINTKGTGTTGGRTMASKPATLTFPIIVSPASNKYPKGAYQAYQRIEVDASHAPTVAIGSGTSSSQ